MVVILCVCVCVCVSVTTLAATYLVYMSKVRRYTISCRLFIKDLYCVDFAKNVSFGRYGVICQPATMISDSAPSQQKKKHTNSS